MERLKQKLEAVLQNRFLGSEAVLNVSPYSAKIGGILAWRGFTGLEPIDRLRKLSETISAQLSQDEQSSLALIVTLSPAEYAVYKSEQNIDRQSLAA